MQNKYKKKDRIRERNISAIAGYFRGGCKDAASSKVGVETVIKKQIDVLSETLGSEGEEVLQNIGVTDEYLSQQTQAVLDSIKADDATVDTITDTIMDIVEDVDGKFGTSFHYLYLPYAS